MEAPVLTPAEQKAALRKKKKKILKNVLDLPKYLKVKSTSVEDSEAEKLKNILERLLPPARLPTQQNLKCTNTSSEETTLKETARLKRKQLAIGVNDLNKSIKNGLISAALLASDIEPKFLVHHLSLLCIHNKIPYLHMVGLRAIVKECLGFPCIALGFKKNSDFSEAINEIKTVFAKSNKDEINTKSEADVTYSERVTEEKVDKQNHEFPVTYLYRSSVKERVFIPEKHIGGKETNGFIQFDKGADVNPKEVISDVKFHLGKKASEEKFRVKEDSSSEENFEVPRKKPKKNWVVNETGKKEKFRYHAVNLVKMSSNPHRIGKKRKS